MQRQPHTQQTRRTFHIRPWGIRAQLMLFLCVMSLALLSLVWILSSTLLQPYYNEMMYGYLEDQLDEIIDLMDTTTENGIMISTRTDDVLIVNAAFQTAFYQAIDNNQISLSDVCINIADSSLSYVLFSENLYPCLLHGGSNTLFGESEALLEDRDNDITLAWREECFETGECFAILTLGDWQQMLLGKTTADGQYVVFVSATLSQLVGAGLVLQALAPLIGVAVLAFAVAGAWLFSRWFTRPIVTLTAASHEIASGNYDVALAETNHGELDELTCSFNTMAKEVQRTSQLQRDLLANISHDLRTPLTLIRGYAETLRDITGAKKEKREEQLDIIIDETDRLTGLVNSVLELSKVTSRVEQHTPAPLAIGPFCETIAGRYRGVCAQNGWQLEVVLPPEPLTIFADAAMLERALDNLLGNAMQHIGADGVFILRAYLSQDGTCHIEVEDHGAGVAKEDQAQVFDRYYRNRENTSKVGTGLGLSIARAIFLQHGFEYGLQSNPNECTIFWFSAPLMNGEDAI